MPKSVRSNSPPQTQTKQTHYNNWVRHNIPNQSQPPYDTFGPLTPDRAWVLHIMISYEYSTHLV